MPALNAARTLAATVSGIPRDWVDEIILVDDGSQRRDRRARAHAPAARHLAPAQRRLRGQPEDLLPAGAPGRRRRRRDAASRRAVRADADPRAGQADPRRTAPTSCSDRGSWKRAAHSQGGMPLYKFLANRALTTIENRALGTSLSELHTGYRAYSRELLMSIPFLRNSLDFSFDSELLMQVAHFDFRIAEVPGAHDLLRRGLVGRARRLGHIRAEDARCAAAGWSCTGAGWCAAGSSVDDGARSRAAAPTAGARWGVA